MRQVADEERLARRARDHFRPLVPRPWHAVVEEILRRMPRPLAPAQAHERRHVAPLVGRVVLPLALARFALAELAPVALEGVVKQVRRQPSLLAAGRQRDGGRVRVDRKSEEHTSELQSLMRISYAVFCLKKKKK